jgi:hypothetical protein
MPRLKCKYFSLKQEKVLNNEIKIPANKEILYLCTDKEHSKYLHTSEEMVVVFWAKDDEVEFTREEEQDFDEKNAELIQKTTTNNYL